VLEDVEKKKKKQVKLALLQLQSKSFGIYFITASRPIARSSLFL
jgi:hypothetical protein